MLDERVGARFSTVTKRDGRMVPFDPARIKEAVAKAMETSNGEVDDIDSMSGTVRDNVMQTLATRELYAPTIEQIQDIVEEELILTDLPKTAKHYILYRNERARMRGEEVEIPEHVRDLVSRSKEYFQNALSEFIFYRTYSRYMPTEGRRETWIESVGRYMSFMSEKLGTNVTKEEYAEIEQAILHMEAMPSMRLMWSAGDAVNADNACAYNCSFTTITTLRDFGEILYLLMCGCGVGFSVERQNIEQLPMIAYQYEEKTKDYIAVLDSKDGWADALIYCMGIWFEGGDIEIDYSFLRPAGARLKTMGGRSAGPDPLIDLMTFTRAKILSRQGRRLTSLDVHDIVCKIGDIVVAGGVRRSSLISLSDLDDVEMRDAKQGHFFLENGHRRLANNSVAYQVKPTQTEFIEEWLALAKSGSGERGIFNRANLAQQIPSRRLKTIEDALYTMGTNPCGEIFLKPKQFCNLTEVVARPDDTLKSLKRKVRIAAILGTFQSTLTEFPYLSPEWKQNCEQERLLGVSVTGQWDSPAWREIDTERWCKAVAVDINREFAERFGINVSTAVTCVKPSGTVSPLVNAASGLHPRYSQYYIRRVRVSATDPLFQMLRDQKWPHHPETGQTYDSATTYVLDFPVKAPDGSTFKDDLSAIEQLEYWKQIKENFTEHNPSCTIFISEDEWLDAGYWVYKNWEIIGGLAFLPRETGVYRLAPHEAITAEKYEQLMSELPDVDFSRIIAYEKDDNTTGSKTYACVGDSCEV